MSVRNQYYHQRFEKLNDLPSERLTQCASPCKTPLMQRAIYGTVCLTDVIDGIKNA